MGKFFKSKDTSGSPAGKTDISQQLDDIKKQLNFLEKKIDSLMNQSGSPRSGKSQFSHQGNRNSGRGFKSHGLTKATCSECNSICEIPFKPTGNRPVYCSDCFSKHKKSNPSTNNRFDRPRRSSFDKPKKSGFERFFKRNK